MEGHRNIPVTPKVQAWGWRPLHSTQLRKHASQALMGLFPNLPVVRFPGSLVQALSSLLASCLTSSIFPELKNFPMSTKVTGYMHIIIFNCYFKNYLVAWNMSLYLIVSMDPKSRNSRDELSAQGLTGWYGIGWGCGLLWDSRFSLIHLSCCRILFLTVVGLRSHFLARC